MLLWVLGFELGPDLHLAMHGALAPHVHGHASQHEHEHEHEHEHDVQDRHDASDHDHGAAHHSVATDHPIGARVASGVALVRALDPGHGRHDASHRGIAVKVPPSPMPVIVSADVLRIACVDQPHGQPHGRGPLHTRARGPPTSGFSHAADHSL